MKLISKAGLAFKKLKPADKPGFGAKVIAGLNAHAAIFPDLPVTIQILQDLNGEE